MFKIINWRRVRAERFRDGLPDAIRRYLKGRGIPSTFIEDNILGWDGDRITIPIFGREPKEIVGFRYAKPPEDLEGRPEMLSDAGATPELYGWDTLAQKPTRVVIAEGELDRLVLEARGFPSVASTAGPDVLLPEWVPSFKDVKHIWIAFGERNRKAAKSVKALLPSAHIVELPFDAEDLAAFFAGGRTRVDFEILLATAAVRGNDNNSEPPLPIRIGGPRKKKLQERMQRAKRAVHLHEIVGQDTDLRAEGGRLAAHCPFHDDYSRSFSVYPKSDTYYCTGCEAQGDVFSFLLNKESMNYEDALEQLERFSFTHELYGTSS